MTSDGILNPRRSSPAWRACAIGRIEADAVGIEALSGALVGRKLASCPLGADCSCCGLPGRQLCS